MANPSIWAPGAAINANSSLKTQAFIAALGQTDFTLTNFTYAVNTGSLLVFVGSGIQRVGVDWLEVSSSEFSLVDAPPEGTVVYAVGFTEVTTDIPVIGAPALIGADVYVKTNPTADGYTAMSPSAVLADIEAAPAVHDHDTLYEPLNPNLLETADIGVSVQAYDATLLNDADIGVSVQAYDADTAKLDVAQQFTARQRTSPVTDNDLSFDLSAGNDFICTPTGNGTLTFTNITAGCKGEILLDNTSNYTISKAAAVKCPSSMLTTISATGRYRLAYSSLDGTNVDVTNSGALS